MKYLACLINRHVVVKTMYYQKSMYKGTVSKTVFLSVHSIAEYFTVLIKTPRGVSVKNTNFFFLTKVNFAKKQHRNVVLA